MRAFVTCPTLRPHGGVRVLIEWANRLPDVVLRVPRIEPVDWATIAPHVFVTDDDDELGRCDVLIAGSPHAVDYLDLPGSPLKRFAFLQMLEHMFRPDDTAWRRRCKRFYHTTYPLILISRWNKAVLNRIGPTHYVGNGVNVVDFPVERAMSDGRAVLVEGWNATNPTKDTARIGPKVAARLKAKGCRIIAYAAQPPTDFPDVPDEFYVRPDLATLNDLYRRATILLKATHCDARSTAPLEAMTKGTPTVRAITDGDDDLTDENSIRVPYSEDAAYQAACALLNDRSRLSSLSRSCLEYVEEHSWEKVWPSIEAILSA